MQYKVTFCEGLDHVARLTKNLGTLIVFGCGPVWGPLLYSTGAYISLISRVTID